jgi:hypothetical protein
MALHATTDIILNTGLANHNKVAGFLNENDNGPVYFPFPICSISISNVGAVDAIITLPKTGSYPLPAGSTVSFDAGGNDNTFPEGTFECDSTSTILLIAYTSNI